MLVSWKTNSISVKIHLLILKDIKAIKSSLNFKGAFYIRKGSDLQYLK